MPKTSQERPKKPRRSRKPVLRDRAVAPRSRAFTAGPDGGVELKIRGIPSLFWRRVRNKAKREHISVRAAVLHQMLAWVRTPDASDARR
jgi:hypothetical protein